MEGVVTPVPVVLKRPRGRPRKYPLPPGTEPPPKRQKYTALFGSADNRSSRRHTTGLGNAITPVGRVRDEGDLRYSSAAAAAASAISHSDSYKPREERSWEEFHPDLDLDASLPAFNAEDVDAPLTPATNGIAASPMSQNGTPVPGQYFVTPMKKRGPGRPPKRPEAMFFTMGSPSQKIAPVPLQNPKEKLVLPKPTYRQIETFAAYEKSSNISVNYVDKGFANAGFQESEIFVQPRTLIRGGKSAVEDEHEFLLNNDAGDGSAHAHAKVRVEYDMDEQDERWLEGINAERASQGADAIRPQHFEIAMTLIEKEWHALERRIPKSNPKPPQTHRPRSNSAAAVNGEPTGGEDLDSKCAVCDDGDCENTNAIVFCDGCDLAVHQECYGVPFIPEGQWLCRRCQLVGRSSSAAIPNDCIFCPNTEGAFKQTTNMKWAHLLCALWIPEVSIGNQTFMEPIQDVEKVPKQRWKLTCYICQQKMGACIQCSNKSCYLAFHVTCARRCHLQLKMKNPHGGMVDLNTLKGYCDKHVPSDWRQEHDVESATARAKDFYRREFKNHQWADSQQSALSTERAYHGTSDQDAYKDDDVFANSATDSNKKALMKKIWRLPSGAPIVPHFVFKNIDATFGRYSITRRKEFLAETCKYWTLKREARRGASLLKRLQLQLELFSSMEMTRRNFAAMGAAGGPKLQQRIEFATALEGDIDQIKTLCLETQEREALKSEDIETLRYILDTVYFPIIPLLSSIFDKVVNLDSSYNYFTKRLQPVQQKLEQRVYISVASFASDLGQALNESVFGPQEDNEPPKPVSEQLNAVETKAKHKDLQKDKLARAKRTLKAITTELLEAAGNEADLSAKPRTDYQNSITLILEHALDPRTKRHDGNADHPLPQVIVNGDSSEAQINGSHSEDIEMRDADEVVSKDSNLPNGLLNGMINGVHAIHHESSEDHGHTRSARETPGPNFPALSTGSSNRTASINEPLTPPSGDKLPAINDVGGVPWYLEEFDPIGTTIHDPHMEEETNRAGRSSSELSEIDDDVLNGTPKKPKGKPGSTGTASPIKKKNKAKRRK